MKAEGRMPLLPFVSSLYPNLDLSHTVIVACQHILRAQLNLLDELESKGLEPENFYLIGKNYSTNVEVYEEFLRRGIHISKNSMSYDSHDSFDTTFEEYIKEFLKDAKTSILPQQPERIIFVDCGGFLISRVQEIFADVTIPLVAIEQTSSGYEILKRRELLTPVINVARSWAKELEAPFVADAATAKIRAYFGKTGIVDPRILVIGRGNIGESLKKALSVLYPVAIYDIEAAKSEKQGHVREHLNDFNVIIGATGSISLTPEDLALLNPGTHLISVSSSDREFSSAILRAQASASHNSHENIDASGIHLVNSGFPINFDGSDTSLPTERAQLVVALMLGSIYEARSKSFSPGFVDLDNQFQETLVAKFRELVPSAGSLK